MESKSVKRTVIPKQSEPEGSCESNSSWEIREITITPMPLNDVIMPNKTISSWATLPNILNKATFDLAAGDKVAIVIPISSIIGNLMFYYLMCDDELMNLSSYVHHIDKENNNARLIISNANQDERRHVSIVWL
jgi:hypothetical protein